ncbi:MAG: hypothetical protein QXD51_03655, partial [Candidatus Anstonellales archaeon]
GAEPSKEDTVYLPQAVIDSAFNWQYGKVQEVNKTIINAIEKAFAKDEFTVEVPVDIGDGWVIEVSANFIGIYGNGKGIGGFATKLGWNNIVNNLRSGYIRFIKYTDEYGNNLLIVKTSDKIVDIFVEGIPGHGLIMIMDDNSPFTIGRIGVFRETSNVIAVLAEIEGDGIVGIGIKFQEHGFTDVVKVASIR